MNAGPWLPVPPAGYGGIENVVATLVPELRARGARVILCAAPGSALEADELVETLPAPMFEHIAGPYNQMMGIAHAHMQHVVRRLREGGVDVVHDHLEVVGASTLAAMAPAVPPVLHTLHWDLRKHPDFYGRFDGAGRVWCNGVSESQVARAPEALRRHALGAVPLAVDPAAIPFRAEKGSRFLVLARITEVKGQDLAAQACREGGWALDIAGPVAGAADAAALEAGLADPASNLHRNADVRFYLDRVRPLEDGEIAWVGSLTGAEKLAVLGRARALLTPIRWDEPGGTAVVEALACGTPVVACDVPALREVLADRATFVALDDLEALVRAAERAARPAPAPPSFTWDDAARATWAVYRELV